VNFKQAIAVQSSKGTALPCPSSFAKTCGPSKQLPQAVVIAKERKNRHPVEFVLRGVTLYQSVFYIANFIPRPGCAEHSRPL
jgi:hypothetical protein